MSVEPEQRHTRRRPCPVCGGFDEDRRGQGRRCHGFMSADDTWCHCSRDEHAGGLRKHPNSETFAHRMIGHCDCGHVHGTASTPSRRLGAPSTRTVSCHYTYTDSEGNPLYRKVRYEPKSFSWESPDGQGGWTRGRSNNRRVPYGLHKLGPASEVFVVEGEKDVHTLEDWGLIATTAGSAQDWCEELVPHFTGKEVVILLDNDDPGRRDALTRASALLRVARSVKIIELPGLPEKGDVTDWKEEGHAMEELKVLVNQAQPMEQEGLEDFERRWFPEVVAVQDPAGEPEPSEDLASLRLPDGAWSGLAQQYVDLVGRATEAPEAFHLASLITAAGCLVGRKAWFQNPHPTYLNFYTVLIGATGTARKTTSYRFALDLLRDVAERAGRKVKPLHGLASVEGLAMAMLDRDAQESFGVLAVEDEFRSLVSKGQQRAVSNLVPRLTELFSTPAKFEVNTRTDRIEVNEPFLSILASSTPAWFSESISASDVGGGFVNRWTVFPGASDKLLPFPERIDQSAWSRLVERTIGLVESASGEYQCDQEGRELYADFYQRFRQRDEHGAVAEATSRIDAHVMKLALFYAIAAGNDRIDGEAMRRAVALGEFLWRSSKAVTADIGVGPTAKTEGRLLELLARGPLSTREVLRKLKVSAAQLSRMMQSLVAVGRIRTREATTIANRTQRILELAN